MRIRTSHEHKVKAQLYSQIKRRESRERLNLVLESRERLNVGKVCFGDRHLV